ncbi:uncharacterized protein F5147DRAFT_658997 [Suillus discolor]|uniref:Uncharacterized protein n=1 Tax=Suillus discolor TaxID=1912936 RepID=A0A9P7JLR9_9AGAM|nr:uncharacterized protein F5147DRAFT_658997 [Suillus discolor]KAG2087260.1 hypothetical protein F5147DRAFT_658997 [Suillus discolor]
MSNNPWSSTKQQIPHQLEVSADQTPKLNLSSFPLPNKGSGQKHGKDWKAFFAHRLAQNKKKKERETPSAQQAQIENVWGDYNNTTRVFDSFSNQWDLYLAINPNSIPDGDDREDDDDIMPPMLLTIAPPPPPPSYSSFLNDIRSYFNSHKVASSAHYDHIETFVSVLLPSRICKMQWLHTCKLIGDLGQDLMVSEEQQGIIKSFLGYLVTLSEFKLSDIQSNLWDLGPHPSLCPFSELRAYSPGCKPLHFKAVFADYVVYKQCCHEFMNQPHMRATLLHGRLIWQLALHSLGIDHLPSVLDGISWEAVPFGLMLCSNDQSHFDNALLEEEIEFICGMYYMNKNDGSVEKVSWWPRPQAWAASSLNIGFWSAQCVSHFHNSAPNDANGPLSATQWKRSLKFNNTTLKMMKNIDVACYEFLLNKAPVWMDSDV